MFGKPGRRANQAQGRPMVINSTVPPVVPPMGPGGYTAGWAAIPATLAPWQQIGAYAGSMLNQFPANLPGPQLHSGREWGSTDWYTPTTSYVPNGSVQLTQTPGQYAGAQRAGSIYGGPIGPLTANKYAAAVTAAQVRQSGLQAMNWALSLSS